MQLWKQDVAYSLAVGFLAMRGSVTGKQIERGREWERDRGIKREREEEKVRGGHRSDA